MTATAEPSTSRRRPGRRWLRASAIRVKLNSRKAAKKEAARKQAWQEEAWDYFDAVPEVKSLMWFLGNAMSKVKLYVAVRPLDDPNAAPIPATDPESGIPLALARRAHAELDRLKGPLGGRSEIVREASMNVDIAGECYLIGWAPRTEVLDLNDGSKETVLIDETWEIRSTREVTIEGEGVYYVKDDPFSQAKGRKLDENTDVIIRIYQRHPGASALADSHMRGVLSECELLTLLTNELKAESKSRQSAGILVMSNNLSSGSMNSDDIVEGDDEQEADPFDEALMNALVSPIEDPAAAEAVYPFIIRGNNEDITPDVLRHFTLARDTTNLIEERIEKRVQRLARGLNAPVEATMGHQSTTFANAFQINEDTFEDHLQPRCVLLADGLTVGYMRPNLVAAAAGAPELIDRLIVWFDPVDVFKHIDPAESAETALENGSISWDAYRTYKGFSEDDAPDVVEHLFRAILKITRPDPNLVDAIIGEVDPSLDIPEPVNEPTGGTPTMAADRRVVALRVLADLLRGDKRQETLTAAAKVRERVRSQPGHKLYEIDRELRTKVLHAANAAMNRALERAGTKLKVQRDAPWRTALKSVNARFAAATIGRDMVLAAGFQDEDLIGDEAWAALEEQYRVWGAQAQRQALDVVNGMIGISTADRNALQLRQAANLDESWSWMSEHLHELAVQKLYAPDMAAGVVGEFDPTMNVPTGLVRQAIARAGGATLEVSGTDPFVALSSNGSEPLGGIGTGQLLGEMLSSADVLVEAYEWVYGPAYRMSPFEEHLALDGEVFQSFDSSVLEAGDWVGDYYFPGDHDGCACDFIPTYVLPEDLSEE